MASVGRRRDKKAAAVARLTAVGAAYLGFAHDEPGLFQTAFACPTTSSTPPWSTRTRG